jgi:hypothetical protein
MDVNLKTNLHCGACGEKFDDVEELSEHIENCPAAIVILPLFRKQFGSGFVGHPYSYWIQILKKSQPLIAEYARSISNEYDNLTRSNIHVKMCESLGLDYKKFRPFESAGIKEVPTYEDTKRILWYAIENAIEDWIMKEYHLKNKEELALRNRCAG